MEGMGLSVGDLLREWLVLCGVAEPWSLKVYMMYAGSVRNFSREIQMKPYIWSVILVDSLLLKRSCYSHNNIAISIYLCFIMLQELSEIIIFNKRVK